MKRLFFLLPLLTIFVISLHADVKYSKRYNKLTNSWNSYPEVTIHDIQFNHLDSLLAADAIQTTNAARWTLQMADRVENSLAPPYGTNNRSDDTVTITGLCVIPPKIIGYTAAGFTMVLYDTGVGNAPWSGIVVRCNSPTDTLQNIADGFLSVERGDIVKITGVLSEFPTSSMNSLTQFQPIAGISIDILNPLEKAPIPAPVIKGDSIEHFYQGTYQSSGPYHVQYSTGEQYEGMIVEFTNLTITGYANVGGRNAIIMNDAEGNTLAMHDASKWFTVTGAWKDPSSTWTLPPVYAVMDTIRGVMIQISGTSGTYGYVIAPMFPGDVVFGVAKPTVSSHQRIPNFIPVETFFEIRARALRTTGGYPIDSVFCMMSENYGPFVKHPMTIVDTGNTYGTGNLLDLPAGTFVRYFIEAFDTGGQSSKLAYQGVGLLGTDTSLGFFNFTVLNRDPVISDIQYTPYTHGVSPYYGATVTLKGIVTADSSDMDLTAHSGIYGTHAFYLQSGNAPWSGIWLVSGTGDSSLAKVRRGDSISVTGTVGELNSVTQIYNIINTATVLATGKPVPAPVTVPTSTFSTGNPAAEKYEGMLVRVVGTKVSNIAPIFSDQDLYEVDDGSGGVLVAPDGKNTYTNAAADSTLGLNKILYANDPVDTLTGVLYFSGGSRYAICPRLNDDIVAGHHADYDGGWNIVSIGRTQTPAATGYNTTTLFPGAASQAFKFAGAYVPDTAVWHGVGYWVKFNGATTYRQLGAPRTLDTMGVVAGWNLVGMIGDSIDASTVSAQPMGNTLSSFFSYKSGYSIATTLKPTQGYWVKASMDGSIIMSSSGFAKSSRKNDDLTKLNTLTIEDGNGLAQTLYFGADAEGTINLSRYEMPPSAMLDVASARFSSGRAVETYSAELSSPKQFGIEIKRAEGPVTVKWNIAGNENNHFTLSDVSGKASVSMTGTGETKLYKAPELMYLNVMSGGERPKEFSMSQNYPNPFNPTTQFMVALPNAAHLEVGVYNILGQKVATLINESREAGYYPVVWNSSTDAGVTASSGVYFVKMTAGSFNAVKKIVLMK